MKGKDLNKRLRELRTQRIVNDIKFSASNTLMVGPSKYLIDKERLRRVKAYELYKLKTEPIRTQDLESTLHKIQIITVWLKHDE